MVSFPNYLHADHPLILFKNNANFLNSDILGNHQILSLMFPSPVPTLQQSTVQQGKRDISYEIFVGHTVQKNGNWKNNFF